MKPTIIVVDDSSVQLIFAKQALSGKYNVIASSSVFISSLVLENEPVLILMDVNMGAVNGGEVVKTLRKYKFGADLKIYFNSSEKESELKELVKSTGADGYIAKCKTPDQLLVKVNEILK